MQIALYKIIIQCAYANQVTQEIHNLVAISWNAKQMMIVQTIRLAIITNALIHALLQIHVLLMQSVSDIIIVQLADAYQALKVVHLNVANVLNVTQISNAQQIKLALIVTASIHVNIIIHVHEMLFALFEITSLVVNVQNICQEVIHYHIVNE